MPKDKTETYNKIIPIAKQEFLEKGFEKASMRSIAEKVGISAMGLYRHFRDKAAMFDELLAPLRLAFENSFDKQRTRAYGFLDNDTLEEMWVGQSDLDLFIDLVYTYFDEFRLLLCCSQGTKHANFVHDFASFEQEETLLYMDEARKRGFPVKEIDPLELHLLLSAYYTAIFEIVVHKFSKEQALHYVKTLQTFFYPGWRAVLGM